MPNKDSKVKIKYILPLLSILLVFIFGFLALITKSPALVDIAWFMLAIFGTYMSLSSVFYSIQCYKSKSWPQSLYTIKNEKIQERISENKKGYHVYADIEYEVNGRKYIKDLRDDYNELSFSSYDQAMDYLKELQSKRYKRIYYNPIEPQNSILSPGINFRSILAIIVGIGLFYIGFASFRGIINWA